MTVSEMNGYRISKKEEENRRGAINALLMLLFFTSTDTVLFGTNANLTFLYVPRIVGLLMVVLFPLLLSKGRFVVNGQFTLCSALVLIMTVSGIVNQAEIGTLLSRIIAVLAAYSIAKYCTLEEFAAVFCKFVYIVSWVAIVIEILAYVLPSVVYAMPSIVNTAGYSHATCFFGSLATSNISKLLIRANGVFWEPGAFAVYLNLALFFRLFVLKAQRTSQLLVYLAALIITFSTAGYICFAFLMIVYILFFNPGRVNSKPKRVMALLSLAAVIVVFVSTEITTLLFGKILNQENTTMVRWYSFVGGFQVAAAAPFVGIFSNNIRDALREYAAESGGMLTNTWTYQFAAYGFPFGILFTWFSYKFFAKFGFKKIVAIFLFVFLLLSYVGEMFYSYLPFVFVFYGLRKSNENSAY